MMCISSVISVLFIRQPLHKKYQYSEFSNWYFPAFGLNTEIYTANLRIQSECGKIQTRNTLNTNSFHEYVQSSKCYMNYLDWIV